MQRAFFCLALATLAWLPPSASARAADTLADIPTVVSEVSIGAPVEQVCEQLGRKQLSVDSIMSNAAPSTLKLLTFTPIEHWSVGGTLTTILDEKRQVRLVRWITTELQEGEISAIITRMNEQFGRNAREIHYGEVSHYLWDNIDGTRYRVEFDQRKHQFIYTYHRIDAM